MFGASGKYQGAGKGAVSSNDPFFSFVKLLMHMDTSAFPDVKGHTVTKVGTPALAATPSFAGSSLQTSNGNYLSVAQSGGDLTLGAGDFTIETWFQLSTGTTNGFGYQLMGTADGQTAAGWAILVNRTNAPAGGLNFVNIGSIVMNYTGGYLSAGVPYILAIVRQGTGSNNLSMFLNGALVAQGTNTQTDGSTLALQLGAQGGGQGFPGYIDEVRFTRGISRYGGPYTPLAVPFPNS